MGLDYTYDFLYDTKLWITPSQQETKANDFLIEQCQKIADMKWSPDGTQLAVVGDGGFVKVFSLKR